MTQEEIIKISINNKSVVIIGNPGSGKTYLYNKLYNNKTHFGIKTDEYIRFGFEQSLYEIFNTLDHCFEYGKLPYIIEGVQGYRFLRKGLEVNKYHPDIVIECVSSKKRQTEIYKKERDTNKLKSMQIFERGLAKVMNDYFKELEGMENKPEFITFENNF